MAALIARQQARLIAEPLEALAAQSARIGELDFAPPRQIDSGIREIRQLASAQESMRIMLQRNHLQIAEQSAELRTQIDALLIAKEKIRDSEAYNKVPRRGSMLICVSINCCTLALPSPVIVIRSLRLAATCFPVAKHWRRWKQSRPTPRLRKPALVQLAFDIGE